MSVFIDTSVLVRYLMNDPPEMAEEADRIIEYERELRLTGVVLAETAHVLASFYQVPRSAVVDGLVDFIRRENVVLHDLSSDLAIAALLLSRPSGRISIPDALTWAAARQGGGGVVYTFDRRFPGEGVEIRSRVPGA